MIIFLVIIGLIGIIAYLAYEFAVYDRKMQELTGKLLALIRKFETFEGDGR